MTIGTGPNLLTRRRRWAAEQLGVSEEASPEQVRTRLMQLLPGEDFVPPTEWRWAERSLSERTLPQLAAQTIDYEARLQEEMRLRDDVEGFAQRYWSLSPDERRQQWQALTDRCADYAPLRSRLGQLRQGLNVLANDPNLTAAEAEILTNIQELFVLRTEARAERRRQLFYQLTSRDGNEGMEQWSVVASKLQARHQHLAALERYFVDALVQFPKRQENLVRRRTQQVARQVPTPSPNGGFSWRSYGWVAYLVIALMGALLKMGGSSRTSTPPRYEPPRISVPDFKFEHRPLENPGPMILDHDGKLRFVPDFKPNERQRREYEDAKKQLDKWEEFKKLIEFRSHPALPTKRDGPGIPGSSPPRDGKSRP